MRIAVVAGSGGTELAQALESALAGAGAGAARMDLSTAAGATALERTAAALRLAEGAFAEGAPDAVVLTDDEDESLAVALVATKLLIPLYRLDPSAQPAGGEANARIDELLADATVPGDPAEAARAIVDALSASAKPGGGR